MKPVNIRIPAGHPANKLIEALRHELQTPIKQQSPPTYLVLYHACGYMLQQMGVDVQALLDEHAREAGTPPTEANIAKVTPPSQQANDAAIMPPDDDVIY